MNRLLALAVVTIPAVAHADPAAALAKAEDYYRGLEHHTETFVAQIHDRGEAEPRPITGVMWFDNGNYRYDLTLHSRNVSVVFDGTSRWELDHGKRTVTASTDPQSLALSLLAGERIASCCTLAADPKITGGIVLTPKKPSASGALTIELVIDARDGHVTRYIETYEHNLEYDVALADPDVKTAIPKSTFVPPAAYKDNRK